MAEMALKEGRNLSLFLLEKYSTCNNVDAYHRCIAWQQLAVQAGYTPQSAADCRHLARMNDAEHAHYEQLRHCDIRALCSPEQDLVPGILARRRGSRRNSSHRSVRVIMPCTTHRAISNKARAHGVTVSEYLVICATDASPGVDLSEIIAVRSEIQQALSLLRSTVVRPELTPADMRALFDASHTISAALKTVTRCLTDLASND